MSSLSCILSIDGCASLSTDSSVQLYRGPATQLNALQHQSITSGSGMPGAGVPGSPMVAPSPSDISDRINDQLLQCAVCCNRFNNVNVPKLLSCSHTFCTICITRYVKKKCA